MPVSSQPPALVEFDIIFAGGGTAACITASRLSNSDPTLRILVLETGQHTLNDLAHIQVARSLTHLLPDSKTMRNIVGKPSEHLNGRQLAVHHGQCVGGGSSINLASFTRATASDYDDWANLYDNPGWSFTDLLPLILKAETYQNAPNRPTHGYDGPLKASYGRFRTNVGEDYLATVAQYDRTRPVCDDANTMIDDINRLEFWPKWIDQNTGRRSDVAHHYLYKTLATSNNLTLFTGCSVKKVIIVDGRAVGVEYVHEADPNDVVRVANAKCLVVLSAGAFGSPAILERSGIGANDVLVRTGVTQVVNLPGVGENYNDHFVLYVPFHAKEDSETLDCITRHDPSEFEKLSAQWHKDGTGLMATNGVDAGMKFRPSDEELLAMGPDVSERWRTFYANAPDKPMLWVGMIAQYVGFNPPPPTVKCYATGAFLTYPAGRGSVHITAADDINSPPDFDTGAFSCKEDVAALRYIYKRSREYGRRMKSYRGEYAPDHPKFPPGSEAAVPQEPALPIDVDAPDIVYTKEDDKAIDEMMKANIMSAWHSLGTCAMKPREQNGVVDSRLNVYGVNGLKVADMSICPSNVGSTYSTAIMIGEKAAMIISEDLGKGDANNV